jgi:hypothetical protein
MCTFLRTNSRLCDNTMRRIQFTLRDLFWLTLVVATGFGWWLDWSSENHKRMTAETKVRLIAGQADRLRTALTAAPPIVDGIYNNTSPLTSTAPPRPDFSVLDEAVIEP